MRNGDAYIMFSGGMPLDSSPSGARQVLTVIHGKSTTVLEMEHEIIDFITLCESPYEADYNDPYAIVVLLSNDLVVVNLQTPGYVTSGQRFCCNPLICVGIRVFKIRTRWIFTNHLSPTATIWPIVLPIWFMHSSLWAIK